MKKKPFTIQKLGTPYIHSPIALSKERGKSVFTFVNDDTRVLLDISLSHFLEHVQDGSLPLSAEKAGPREHLFFDPKKTRAAIVTCGGLCPGINNVIRSLVMGLHYFYGVTDILGVRYGYEGLIAAHGHDFVTLTPQSVEGIHELGGTVLGSSRGAQDVAEMVDRLEGEKIDILFAVGGDGTLKGVDALGEEIEKRGLQIGLVGIPKTIDNDINLIDRSFGFETAFNVASPIIRDAHNEATGVYNGIAIVKLMGRDSGFIAASAALSRPVVNFVLVPEMVFALEGKNGLLNTLEKRLKDRHHAVIVVAEGAGQQLFKDDGAPVKDASGNIKHKDIGLFLKKKIEEHFNSDGVEVTIKYIDPSYIIRNAPANTNDSVLCNMLAHQAVHGAMAGKTRCVVGLLNNNFVYLPIASVVDKRKKIDLEGEFWFGVLQSTGQPFLIH